MNYWSGLYSYIIWLLWMPKLFCAGQFVCSKAQSEHRAACGGTVVLPCHFNGEGRQATVTWQKKTSAGDLVVHVQPAETVSSVLYENRTKMQPDWEKKKDAGLTIKDVTPMDHGTYECYVRLHPGSSSEICAQVSLEVIQGDDVVWATHSQITVKAGGELDLHCGFKPKCFNSKALAVTWSYSNGSSEQLLPQDKGGPTTVFCNGTVWPRGADGNVNQLVQGVSPSQGGSYKCCVGDNPTRPKCALMSVNVTGTSSGAESTLGRHRQYFVALLLIITSLFCDD